MIPALVACGPNKDPHLLCAIYNTGVSLMEEGLLGPIRHRAGSNCYLHILYPCIC